MTKALMTRTNAKGVQYALVQDGETFGVYKLCANYSRHIKGGIAKSWRYVEKNLSRESALALFDRRAPTPA
jgi:hypothetical protein